MSAPMPSSRPPGYIWGYDGTSVHIFTRQGTAGYLRRDSLQFWLSPRGTALPRKCRCPCLRWQAFGLACCSARGLERNRHTPVPQYCSLCPRQSLPIRLGPTGNCRVQSTFECEDVIRRACVSRLREKQATAPETRLEFPFDFHVRQRRRVISTCKMESAITRYGTCQHVSTSARQHRNQK